MGGMNARDRIDPESREGLDALLALIPGGFNAIPDITARRAAVADLLVAMSAGQPPNTAVETEDRTVPGDPDVAVRVYRPTGASGALPGIFYIHGGGMNLGSIDGEDATATMLCEELGVVVVSTDYRKAPEHPHPAQVTDCYTTFTWVAANSGALGIDPDRLAIYGGSAGGNLCIATALMARDRHGPRACFMMPAYPMLDPSNTTLSSHEITDLGIWDRKANIEAWQWFLGGRAPDQYASPPLADDLSDLPPTYLDVGDVDLFRDEDIAFVARLTASGVPVEFHLYPGAYHVSERFAPEAALSRRIWANRLDAFRRAFDY
jgi:acetyl esterase/lipase